MSWSISPSKTAVGLPVSYSVRRSLTIWYVDLVGLLDDRYHLARGEAGLSAPLVVERADPHQPVGTRLDRQRPVRVRLLDGERGRLDPGLLRVRGVVDVGGVPVPLGPA